MEPKVALITGCSTGLGLATSVSLAKESDRKYIVYATMRNLGKSKELEEKAGGALNDTLFIRELDVTKHDTMEKVVGEIKDKHGRVDVLLNNAGGGGLTVVDCAPMKEFRDIMELNFFGCVRLIQLVLPMMKKRQSGRIVNITSVYGIFGMPHLEAYSASKSALEGFSECLAVELRPHGIWVSTIQPGPVKTAILGNIDFHEHLFEDESLDAKTRASYKAVVNSTKYILANQAFPVADTVSVVRQAIEEEKPHMRYRSARFYPFETLKYTDEHGDDYVEASTKLLEAALNA